LQSLIVGITAASPAYLYPIFDWVGSPGFIVYDIACGIAPGAIHCEADHENNARQPFIIEGQSERVAEQVFFAERLLKPKFNLLSLRTSALQCRFI